MINEGICFMLTFADFFQILLLISMILIVSFLNMSCIVIAVCILLTFYLSKKMSITKNISLSSRNLNIYYVLELLSHKISLEGEQCTHSIAIEIVEMT